MAIAVLNCVKPSSVTPGGALGSCNDVGPCLRNSNAGPAEGVTCGTQQRNNVASQERSVTCGHSSPSYIQWPRQA